MDIEFVPKKPGKILVEKSIKIRPWGLKYFGTSMDPSYYNLYIPCAKRNWKMYENAVNILHAKGVAGLPKAPSGFCF